MATNGKIRLQGTDIELVAVGEGGAKGNIKMNATESIITESKKLLMTAKSFYRIASPQTGEVVANGVLKLYSSIIRGVTDAVAVKDSKVAGQRFQKQMNEGA